MENLKPFCLDDVFSGKQIVTRGGLKVKIVHMKEDNSQTPLLGIRYSDNGIETPMCWTMQGYYNEDGNEDVDDLFTVEGSDDKTVGSHSFARPWGSDQTQTIEGAYIDMNSHIMEIPRDNGIKNLPENYNVGANTKTARAALAMLRISMLIKMDERYGGPVTDDEWGSQDDKFVIDREHDRITTGKYIASYAYLAFHEEYQRDLFLRENEQLVKDFLMVED